MAHVSLLSRVLVYIHLAFVRGGRGKMRPSLPRRGRVHVSKVLRAAVVTRDLSLSWQEE